MDRTVLNSIEKPVMYLIQYGVCFKYSAFSQETILNYLLFWISQY